MSLFDLKFWKRSPDKELPRGSIEVERQEDGSILLSFIGDDGSYQWYSFDSPRAVERLGHRLIEAARSGEGKGESTSKGGPALRDRVSEALTLPQKLRLYAKIYEGKNVVLTIPSKDAERMADDLERGIAARTKR